MTRKLRASKISIESVSETAETWVHITVEEIIKDVNGKTTNIVPQYDYISFTLQSIGTTMYAGSDPVTKNSLTSSGYGIAYLIEEIVTEKLHTKYGGTITAQGDVIL